MSYELDQDTALECIDEWAEPDDNGFDFTPPLNYSSTLDYDPDEPYYTWNGDPEEMSMYYDEQQLEQTSHQEQENNYDSKIYSWLESINRSIKSNESDPVKLVTSIFGKPQLTDKQRELNIKIQNKNKDKFYPLLRKMKLDQCAEDIYHYTSEMENPNKQKYGIVVDEATYNKYLYFVGYIRIPDASNPLGFKTEMLGFSRRSDLKYHEPEPDKKWYAPTYRVPIYDKERFINNINLLFSYLKDSLVLDELVTRISIFNSKDL